MISEIRVETKFVGARHRYLHGHLTVTLPAITRRVTGTDGQVFEINGWVSRRQALKRALYV